MVFVSEGVAPEATLDGVAKILSAVIWPFVVIILVVSQRKWISRLLAALTLLAESANRIKVWQIEIDRDIDNELDKTAALAASKPLDTDVSPEELNSAKRVDALVSRVPPSASKTEIMDSVKRKALELAQEYDTTRANMQAGPERTLALNGVFARMRALALAARPFLDEFVNDQKSAGVRLAAISILQLSPDMNYAGWLQSRMEREQPFVFFQASIAILALVRTYAKSRPAELEQTVESALSVIEAHPSPDANTLIVLRNAKKELETS